MAFSQEQRDEIIRILQARGAIRPCEVCGQNNFGVQDTAIHLTVRDLTGPVQIPGTSIPAVAVFCSNCGNIRFHAMGILGLLPREQQPQ
jgi:hypothetical protein